MRIKSIIIVGFALIILHINCINASTYIVGDALNWVEPPIDTTYSIWASTHVFVKGDFLVFKFNSGIHNVAEVTKKAYKKCNTTNSTTFVHAISPVNIPLVKKGRKYFISTLNNDCQNGLKLAIDVLARLPPPPPPASPPATSPAAVPSTDMSAPPMSTVTPNDPTVTPPPPSQNSAPLIFGHVSLFSVFVMVILSLVG
ncbi:hypothetical protein RND81_07G109800 [Saponaria officinalis]|uniref:Phytocyanin domain-containing protein n=1 Tax=Saponaria officinalis TaxID=3572 RepID=A0AAW1JQK1_SAPOF